MYDDYDANGQPPAIPDEPTPVTGVTGTGKNCVQKTVPESQHIPEQEIASGPEQTPDPDTIPELPADADRNERIRQANLIMAQIRHLYGQKETGTYISFTADLGIIVRVRALKERIGGHDFIQAAHDCGVGNLGGSLWRRHAPHSRWGIDVKRSRERSPID